MAGQDLALNILLNARDNASSTIRGIGGALGSLASAGPAGLAVAGLAAVAAGAVAVGVVSTKMAADYQTGINTLVTGAGEAQSNIKMVSDGILGLSMSTGTSTKQLTDGMYLIESAGYHGQAGLDVLKVAAQGAKVGNAELGTVAGAVTTVLTDYHMKTSQAGSAMNGLITTVASGKTTLQALSSSMGNVLPLAASLGVSFPQVGGAMATMTNAGMNARRASQNLANTMRSLAAPNAVAQKSMQAVGLSAQQVKDTLSKGGLTAAIQLVEDHVGKKFPAGSVAAVTAFKNIMGGATGYTTALMLGGKNMTAFQANVNAISAAMAKGGSTVIGWSLVQDSFNQKMAQAHAVLNVLLISLGQKLLPVLTGIVGAILPVVTGFAAWVVSGQAASSTATLLGNVMNAVLMVIRPIGAFLASVFVPVWQQLQQTVMSQVVPAWRDLMTSLAPIMPQLQLFGKLVGGVVVVAIVLLVGALAGLLKAVAGALSGIIVAFGGIVKVISGAVQVVSGVISFFVDLFTGKFNKLGNDIATICGGWVRIFSGTWDVIRGIFQAAIGAVVGFVTGFWTTIVGIFTRLYDTLVGHSIVPDMCTAIVKWFQNLGQMASQILTVAINAIIVLFTGLGSRAISTVTSMASSVISGFQRLGSSAISTLTSATNNIINSFRNMGSQAMGAVNSMAGSILGRIGSLAGQMGAYGRNLVSSFIGGIQSMAGAVGNAASGIANQVKNFLGIHSPAKMGPLSELMVWGPNLVKTMASGINQTAPVMADAANNIAGVIATSHKANASHHKSASGSKIHVQHHGLTKHANALHHHATHVAAHSTTMRHHATHMATHHASLRHHATHMTTHHSTMKHHATHMATHHVSLKHHATHMAAHTAALHKHANAMTSSRSKRQGSVLIDDGSIGSNSLSTTNSMQDGGITINNTFNINVQNGNPQQIYQYIKDQMARDLRRGGNITTSTSGGRI